MKKYTGKIAMAGLIILLFVGAGLGLYYVEHYEDFYYTQVDNTKVKELVENKEYRYSLMSYNKNGKKKELSFKTSRKLKEDAYLKLTIRSLGVHRWEEIDIKDIPSKAIEKMEK